MFDFITLYSVLGANLLFSFILALIVYIRSQKYYRPLIKKDKDGNPINLHEIYDPFHPHDSVCFIQLWFGAFFCALIKLISSFFIVIFVNWHIKIISKIYKDYNTNPDQRKKMRNAIACWSSMFLVMNGIWIQRAHLDYEDVYKKYLGDDYDFTDDKYSIILSNHIGFFEIVLCMRLFAPGFIAKLPVKDFWFVGPISQGLNCLFVDRTNEQNKKQIFEQLLDRQTRFYKGTLFSPMVIFPEGTCSCCRNILRFKKGAFYSLLPVKPMILRINQRSSFHLSVGASNVVLHYVKNLCHFINTIDYTILPTVRPVDYLFEHNQHLGKEKWQIYANVVRKIYSEVGGLVEVDMGMRDLNRYIKAMRTGFYDPFENMDYEHTNSEGDADNANINIDSSKNVQIVDKKIEDEINTNSDKKDEIIEIDNKDDNKEDNEEKKEDIIIENDNKEEKENIEDEEKCKDEEKNKNKDKDKEKDNIDIDILDENRNEAEEKLLGN